MKLEIRTDKDGKRHTSLGGISISDILMGLTLVNRPHEPSIVELKVLPSSIEVEVDASVILTMGDKKYSLKE